jgi:hypothetical protein
MLRHESKDIELHNEIFDVDLNMIELITKINKIKLVTRGCCENWNNEYAYIIFNYNCFIELLKNNYILKFIDEYCNKSEIYYALNDLRHIKYNDDEYNEKFKDKTEIWIYITFPNILIKDFVNIVENLMF